MISNRTRAARSSEIIAYDFRPNNIALHSVQLKLLIIITSPFLARQYAHKAVSGYIHTKVDRFSWRKAIRYSVNTCPVMCDSTDRRCAASLLRYRNGPELSH